MNANELRNLIVFRTRQRKEATNEAERQKLAQRIAELKKQLRGKEKA